MIVPAGHQQPPDPLPKHTDQQDQILSQHQGITAPLNTNIQSSDSVHVNEAAQA